MPLPSRPSCWRPPKSPRTGCSIPITVGRLELEAEAVAVGEPEEEAVAVAAEAEAEEEAEEEEEVPEALRCQVSCARSIQSDSDRLGPGLCCTCMLGMHGGGGLYCRLSSITWQLWPFLSRHNPRRWGTMARFKPFPLLKNVLGPYRDHEDTKSYVLKVL